MNITKTGRVAEIFSTAVVGVLISLALPRYNSVGSEPLAFLDGFLDIAAKFGVSASIRGGGFGLRSRLERFGHVAFVLSFTGNFDAPVRSSS